MLRFRAECCRARKMLRFKDCCDLRNQCETAAAPTNAECFYEPALMFSWLVVLREGGCCDYGQIHSHGMHGLAAV